MSRLIGMVRCDADGCGWELDGVPVAEYLDRACPKCGAQLSDAMDALLIGFAEFLIRIGAAHQDKERAGLSVHVDTDRRATK